MQSSSVVSLFYTEWALREGAEYNPAVCSHAPPPFPRPGPSARAHARTQSTRLRTHVWTHARTHARTHASPVPQHTRASCPRTLSIEPDRVSSCDQAPPPEGAPTASDYMIANRCTLPGLGG
eukprot:6208366-Pleurochrysis_carterae.AAC.1